MDNLLDASKDLEIKILRDQCDKLKHELIRCQILLKEADPDAHPGIVSDQEVICVQEISKLRAVSDDQNRQLSAEECKNLDLLHKNLKIARGQTDRVKPQDKAARMTSEELMAVLKGSNESNA